MLVLDSQKLDMNIPLKEVYDFVSEVLKKGRFKEATKTISGLKSRGVDVIPVALDTKTDEFFEREGISHITRKDVTETLLDLQYGEISYKFVRNLAKIISEIDPPTTHRGIELPPLDEKTLWRFFVFPSLKSVDTFRELIKKYKPQEAIVLNNAHFYQKLFMLSAQGSGIVVADKSGTASDLPWKAKVFAIKNFGTLNFPHYLKNLKPKHIHAEPKRKKKILIAHDYISPSKVIPWAKKLAKKYEVVYVGIKEQGEEFEKAGIKYRRIQDYATESVIESIRIMRRIFHKDFGSVFGHPKVREALFYNGVDLSSALEEMFLYEYYIGLPVLAAYVELFNKMIAAELPDLIATVDDRARFGKVLIEVANQKGIKSLIVQHGALLDHPMFDKSKCTKFAAYGEQTKKLLLHRKWRKDQLAIVGLTEEIPLESPERLRRKICAELNLNPKKPLVTFASQPFPELAVFHNAAKEFPEIQFVVKPHPDEPVGPHEEFVKRFGMKNITIRKDMNIRELILASDLVINIYSTVGMEGLSLGKPVISINGGLPRSYFPEGTGAYIVRGAKHLKEAINNIITKNKRPTAESIKKGNRYYVKEIGEKACNNVAKLVDSMVK